MAKSARLKLHGFNNLTKTLSFNIYDINYAATADQERGYIQYIDAAYSADRLTDILNRVANIIGASVAVQPIAKDICYLMARMYQDKNIDIILKDLAGLHFKVIFDIAGFTAGR